MVARCVDNDVAQVYKVADVVVGGEGILLLESIGLESLIQESPIHILDLQRALQLRLGDLAAICNTCSDTSVLFRTHFLQSFEFEFSAEDLTVVRFFLQVTVLAV